MPLHQNNRITWAAKPSSCKLSWRSKTWQDLHMPPRRPRFFSNSPRLSKGPRLHSWHLILLASHVRLVRLSTHHYHIWYILASCGQAKRSVVGILEHIFEVKLSSKTPHCCLGILLAWAGLLCFFLAEPGRVATWWNLLHRDCRCLKTAFWQFLSCFAPWLSLCVEPESTLSSKRS